MPGAAPPVSRAARGFVAIVLLATGVLVAWACSGGRQRERPGDILLVVVDTLRRDHLAAYGYPRATSPTIDALAARGIALDGIAPSSWTKPSTASILTGFHPAHHGAVGRMEALPASVPSLADGLRRLGYATVAVSANGWVAPRFGFDHGFDEFRTLERRRAGLTTPAGQVAAAACSLLAGRDGPVFAYVHFVDPHLPYDSHRTWDGRPRSGAPFTLEEADAQHIRHRPPELLARAVDLYDGEIRQADDAIATLLTCLAQRGTLERTLILVTADHGEEFEEHGRMSHGQTLYQESVSVPWVAAGPGVARRGHVAARASSMDVTPTILRWAGAAPHAAQGTDGTDLGGLLRGGPAPAAPRDFLLHLDDPDGTALALLRGDHKILLARRPYTKGFFDLAADPGEQRSLWERPLREADLAVARELGAALADDYNALRRLRPPIQTAPIYPWEREAFAALGYVGIRPDARPALPARILPAGPSPRGRLGWEPTLNGPCLAVAATPDNPNLLDGWWDFEAGGRWTRPEATLAIGAGRAEAQTLVLSGINHRGDAPRLDVTVDGRTVLSSAVAPGPFTLRSAPVELPAERPQLVHLKVEPPFVPAAHGLHDDRTLGLFFSTVCLAP